MTNRLDYVTADELRDMLRYIKQFRASDAPFDIAIWHCTGGTDRAAESVRVEEFANAGATWWQEDCSPRRWSLQDSRERIRRGPPKL